jgi:16S rRNA (guanine966-N2)-methyltransferase
MRESVFSSLGARVAEVRFFDLFAGSGAYGLEAWSRGAAGGVFVEKNRSMKGAIMANIRTVARSLGVERPQLEVAVSDVLKWRPPQGARAGLIFADPPYDRIPELAPALFDRFDEWLEEGGVVVFEMPGMVTLSSPGWECTKRLGKGGQQPTCCFFQRASAP